MRIPTTHTLRQLLRLVALTALLAPVGCGDDDRVAVDAALPDADTGAMPDGMVPDGAPDGIVEMCEPGLVDCGDGCTALAGDSANCGSCGNACPTGVTCAVGRCDCEAPLLSCEGLCTDPATDNNNCGMCGNVCREGDICLDGACIIDCEEPDQRCPGTESEYVCSDPQTDSVNCGVCGAACSSGAECIDGSCSCGEGQISCSGACVDPMNDANFCGNCLTSCGEDGVCMDGGCSTCGAGLTACGDVARCTDTDTSRLHCGACDNTCGPGEGCAGGTCTCLPGFTDCDGECAALLSDRNHCGACGIDCGPLGACSGGTCVCQPEATMCGAECAVLDNDSGNCGECGNVCEAGQLCRVGTCVVLNATCETATAITADATITGEVIADGGPPPSGAGCGFGSGAAARFFAVTVPAGQRATAVATSSTDLVLFVQNSCDDEGCSLYSDSPEQVTVNNAAGTAERTFYVGVRGYSSTSGTYDITFTYDTPVVAANASCATATAITADTTIMGEDIAEGGARPPGEGCGSGSGTSALYYAVTVPAGQRVRATATNNSSLVVFVQDACSDTGCTTSSTSEEVTIDNATGSAERTAYVGVRGSSSVTGTYNIEFTYTTPVIADNAACTTATVITEDTTITGENIEEGAEPPTGLDCGGGTGSTALYYAVTVPAGQRARIVADSGSDLLLFRQSACGEADCLDSSDTPEELSVVNPGATPITEYIGVRGYFATTTGTFDLSVTYGVANTNISCATATVVTADTMLTNQATSDGGLPPTATGCGGSSSASTPSLYYSVTVPAGDRVVVATDPDGDIVLFELPMCGAAACVTSTDSAPETLTYTNSTAADVTHVFGVRPWGSFSGTPFFDITFTYSTP